MKYRHPSRTEELNVGRCTRELRVVKFCMQGSNINNVQTKFPNNTAMETVSIYNLYVESNIDYCVELT